MKRLLNTLYITTRGAYIAKEGETITVSVDHEIRIRVPVLTLCGIVCFGGVACSPHAMELCAENGVVITFLSEAGHFKARMMGHMQGNVLLRRTQYRVADNEPAALELARLFIIAKIANCRNVLLRAARETFDQVSATLLTSAAKKMAYSIKHIRNTKNCDELLGREGDAARMYFDVFNELICMQKVSFIFKGISRRPPLDLVNAMLSFVYTLLAHDTTSALETAGIDPYVGFFHKDRPGRPGLALDLMEEFRPFIADRLVLSLINLQQVKPNGFKITESGGVIMDDDTRKTVIAAYQKRKQDEIAHPFLQETVSIGLLPFMQAMLLARYLRNDINEYPPFFWK
jgi:CRISPR-associated protein Cas1